MMRNLNKRGWIILKKEEKLDPRLKMREERLKLLNKRSLMSSMDLLSQKSTLLNLQRKRSLFDLI
jgi:hypothetical protein